MQSTKTPPQTNNTLKTFYAILITQTLSMLGSRMTGFAIGIWVFERTGNVTPLAMVAFFSMLPSVLARSFAGVFVDRWDRRKVMAWSDTGQAVATLLLIVSFSSGAFQLWQLYLLGFITSVFGMFQQPALAASITMLVPDKHRDRANAIQQIVGPVSGIVAPVLAGMLIAVIAAEGVMVIDLITFGIAVGTFLVVDIPRPEQSEVGKAMQGNVWKEAAAGFRYLWSLRALFWVTMSFAVINFLVNMASILFTPYVLLLTDSEAALGIISGVVNAGMVSGGILLSVWGGAQNHRMRTVVTGIVALMAFLVLFGVVRNAVLLAVIGFLMLLPVPIVNALMMSLLQLKIAPDVQGRVFAARGQISYLFAATANLISGPLADHVFEAGVGSAGWKIVEPLVGSAPGAGMGLMMVICGAAGVSVAMLLAMSPTIRNLETILPDYVPVTIARELPKDAGHPIPEAVPAR